MRKLLLASIAFGFLLAPAHAATKVYLGLCPASIGGADQGPEGVAVTKSNTGTAASTAAALPAVAGRLNVITGFEIEASNGTAGAVNQVTVAGLIGGTMTYDINTLAAAATTPQPPPLIVELQNPIPASAVNTAITVTFPALTGGTGVSVNVHGCLL